MTDGTAFSYCRNDTSIPVGFGSMRAVAYEEGKEKSPRGRYCLFLLSWKVSVEGPFPRPPMQTVM